MKDWTGNSKSTYATLGASNHSLDDRAEQDFYATEPRAVEMLLDLETFSNPIWEPACGAGHISEVLKERGYGVYSTDLIDRGYGKGGIDFLDVRNNYWASDIITNPPYSLAEEFVRKALDITLDGAKIAMFMKLTFLEGQKRRGLFDVYPPKIVYVSSSRLQCAKNGEFKKRGESAVCFCWFVWVKGFDGEPTIRWFN